MFVFGSIFLLIVCVFSLCFFSYKKFQTINFIKAFYGINELSEDSLTYALGNNVILIDYDFSDDYINYLISLYEEQGWSLKFNDSSTYSFCYNDNCDSYKFYLDEFFSKNYGLLVIV